MVDFGPNLINVEPGTARLTVDLRNTDNEQLFFAEKELLNYVRETAEKEGVDVFTESLVRFDPVIFDNNICKKIEEVTSEKGLLYKRMYSGAGHDAQMMAKVCPTAMIFVPSKNGISHNPKEFTSMDKIESGANVLFKNS
ncbi:MAG: M20/M25/M40 family metallo-hydrolase [Flammeovirgaceae bacterium]|nr:M20/M25/M40 family metallo-hydrolase [Flammeovirgaceae bacterium]